MVLSAQSIRKLRPVEPFREKARDRNGNSTGLSVCGYDLSIDQDITVPPGGFVLASTMERFSLPPDIVAIMHDKSSLARVGIAVQNTVAEPGWSGYLTLEITNHSNNSFTFRQGDAVCQAVFHQLDEPTELPYSGKYQNQERGPQPARRDEA